MIEPASVDQRKLDADLLQLLSEQLFDDAASFPVVITASSPERLGEVERLIIELGGEIRHRLEAIEMLSAWLTAAAIAHLSASDAVAELELSKPMQIASPPPGSRPTR